MDKIPSFSKNHDELETGLHFGTEAHGVTTWDLRFKTPNGGDYLPVAAMHTIEHLMATVLRNSEKKDNVIYFGPMGCRTGFYFLTVKMDFNDVKNLLLSSLEKSLEFDEVPGNKREECGNYLEHDLETAKAECKKYMEVLKKS